MYTTIKNCRICGNNDLISIMDVGIQSLTGTFPASREEPVYSGPVELVPALWPQPAKIRAQHLLREAGGLSEGDAKGDGGGRRRELYRAAGGEIGLEVE